MNKTLKSAFTTMCLVIILINKGYCQEKKFKPVLLNKYDTALVGLPLTKTENLPNKNADDFKYIEHRDQYGNLQRNWGQEPKKFATYSLLFEGTNKALAPNNFELIGKYMETYPEAHKSFKTYKNTMHACSISMILFLGGAITWIATSEKNSPNLKSAAGYGSVGALGLGYTLKLTGDYLLLDKFINKYNKSLTKR